MSSIKLLMLIFASGLIACAGIKTKIHGDWILVKVSDSFEPRLSKKDVFLDAENATVFSFEKKNKFVETMSDYIVQGEYDLINDSVLSLRMQDGVRIYKVKITKDNVLIMHVDSVNSPFLYFVKR